MARSVLPARGFVSGRVAAGVASLAVLVSIGTTVVPGTVRAAHAEASHPGQQGSPLPVTNLNPAPVTVPDPAQPGWLSAPQAWPAPGVADVAVPDSGFARAAGLPVEIGAAAPGMTDTSVSRPSALRTAASAAATDRVRKVRVEVLDKATAKRAGAAGLALRLTRADGGESAAPIEVRVDYGAFRHLFGGNLAQRLRLVSVPACAGGAGATGCRSSVVAGENDLTAGALTATVPTDSASTDGATTFVLASTTSSSAGSYAATPVSTAATWTAGGNSGDFSYEYPITLPPAPAGNAVPDLDLTYSSQAVDGLSNASNTQGGLAGLGWSLNPGFIERRLVSCAADGYGSNPSANECYPEHDEFVLVMGGRTSELIPNPDPNQPNDFRLRDDPGWRVTRVFGRSNGGLSGSAWKVTGLDGTTYYFGWGQTDAGAATNSVLTVPVWAERDDQPCWTSSGHFCANVVWRWGLDRVQDANENTAAVLWAKESNRYQDSDAGVARSYDRAGYPVEVDYGTNTAQTGAVPDKVVFGVTGRCLSTPCSAWPDTPTDLLCASGATCTKDSPSFFTQKKLSSITTQVWASGSTYNTVDTYDLSYAFPDPGDGTDPALFLTKVQRTGHVGTDLQLPATQFASQILNNRADNSDEHVPRVDRIVNELGGAVDVTYGLPDACTSSYITAHDGHWDSNDHDCYPASGYDPEGSTQAMVEFNKWLVTDVTQSSVYQDPVHTHYDYLGGAAWHHDDDLATPPSATSWNDWRGYQHVKVAVGDTDSHKTHSEYWYYRGMTGDAKEDGTFPSMNVTDGDGNSYEDLRSLSGKVLDEQHRTLGDGSELTRTRYAYVIDQTLDGFGWHNANIVRVSGSYTREDLDGGATRIRSVSTTYNADGLPTEVDDNGGPGNGGRCTRTTYTTNDTAWIRDTPSQVKQVSCADGTVLSRVDTYYDKHAALGDAPADGNPTDVRAYSSATSYVQTTSSYDGYGRLTYTTSPLRNANGDAAATTVYAPASGYPDTVTTTAYTGNPADPAETTTTSLWPSHGQVVKVVDANGNATRSSYDGLGRLTAVYQPGNASSTADDVFAYTVTGDGVPVVQTEQLQDSVSAGNYQRSWSYYDGFGQLRQTQSRSSLTDGDVDLNRMITWTRYDDRGYTASVTAPIWTTGDPGSGLAARPADADVRSQTTYDYDGVGRQISATLLAAGQAQWATTTVYHGDHQDITPPSGSVTEQWYDMLGELTKVVEEPSGAAVPSTYVYDGRGDLTTIYNDGTQDASYDYDWLGRRTHVADADAGATDTTYDADGNPTIVTHTMAGGTTQATTTTYDDFDRPLNVYSGTGTTGTVLSSWTYDTATNGIGRVATATQHDPLGSSTTSTTAYDPRGNPTSVTYTLPGAPAGADSYTYGYGYDAAGHQTSMTYPAMADMAAETVTTSYSVLGLPQTLSGAYTYVSNTDYTPLRQLAARDLMVSGGGHLHRSFGWDDATDRLTGVGTDLVAADGTTSQLEQDNYAYDPAGNLTAIGSSYGSAQVSTRQCFDYDGRNRLTHAFSTDFGNYCTDPATVGTGTGLDPYNLRYGYADNGNLTTVTHERTGVVDSYSYDSTGAAGPHAVTGVTHTDGGTTTGSDSYGYNAYGEMTARTVAGASASLTWDTQQRVSQLTDPTGTYSYAHAADGTRTARKAPDGSTTYFLPGAELDLSGTGTWSATRYYSEAGALVAQRTGVGSAGWTYLVPDRQGSVNVAVNHNDPSQVSLRRYLPFGAHRDAVDVGVDRGFLGKVEDPTGLDELTNRSYDPILGRFLSPDPLSVATDPETLNPYSYAANNPETYGDPSGLMGLNCPMPDGIGCAGAAGHSHPGHYHPSQSPPPSPPASSGGSSSGGDDDHESHGILGVIHAIGHVASTVGQGTANFAAGAGQGIVNGATATVTLGFYDPGLDACPFHTAAGACTAGQISGQVGVGIAAIAVPGADEVAVARAAGEARAVATAGEESAEAESLLTGAARGCDANSFTGGTPVLLADGRQIPIRAVKPGMKVVATDPATATTAGRRVQRVIAHGGEHTMVALTFADGSTITATDRHPIWDTSTRQFTYARDLRPGEQVREADGHVLTVTRTRSYPADITAYNLSIEGIHTYYAGTTPVLVHNSCDIKNPTSFAGATRSDAEQELRNNGWYDAGPTRGDGVRWRQPDNIADQVRIMRGNPADPNPIKQGLYIRFSISGTRYGPFPLVE